MNVYPFCAKQPSAVYVAEVLHDAESGWWVASCDALGVATEAASYDALIERFWAIAPELAAENGMPFNPSSVRVDFVQATGGAAPDLRAG
ncbi:MAG: hypothetical protein A2286_11655 [Gammaproteobacteria bacterium RIFOXYA12_FULL_61_12]|nr:MAG: hypothetical protein A2514_02345 [Gammaproteobacteria bacterium RIFOXYD12_FULL_61_37]OGT93524.1 MAG: hypothetical protein A2286_11655 [Gammaproteobacteria bacterium RIFOXYA12_FULL_61_12]